MLQVASRLVEQQDGARACPNIAELDEAREAVERLRQRLAARDHLEYAVLAGEQLLRPLAFGYVEDVAVVVPAVAFEQLDRPAGLLHPAQLARLRMDDPVLQRVALIQLLAPSFGLEIGGAIVRVDAAIPKLDVGLVAPERAGDPLRVAAEERGAVLVTMRPGAALAMADDDVAHVAEQAAEPEVALAQLRLAALAPADVAMERQPVAQGAGGVAHGHDLQLDGIVAAVLAVVDELAEELMMRLDRGAQGREHAAIGLGALQQPRRAPDQLVGPVAGDPAQCLVDVKDPRPRRLEIRGGDDDAVVEEAGGIANNGKDRIG